MASCVTPRTEIKNADTTTPSVEQASEDKLDALLEAAWTQAGVTPAQLASDAEFARRLYLDLLGRVPTADEARTFLQVSGEGKRAQLVTALLEDPGFSEHWSDVYADLMIGLEPGGQARKLHSTFQAWWAEGIREQRPYNEMVADIITATGEQPIDVAGPAAFLFRHGRKNRIEAVTTEVSRVFLGVQLGCAQCHDHPYDDRYKQEDFYGMAAYFAQSRVRQAKGDDGRVLRIQDRPRGEARVPNPDGTPGKVVSPRFLGQPADGGDLTRREQLASSMLRSEMLAKTLVNRTWSQLLGRGLVEPWDDLGGPGDTSHPPVLNFLAAEFQQHGYDFPWLVRTIVLSSAYQRSSAGIGDPEKSEAVFARAAVRPLSPRQLFRSLIVATGLEASDRRDIRRLVENRREQVLREYLFVFADDEAAQVDAFSGNVPQALLLLNGDLGNRGVTVGASPTIDTALAYYRDQTPEVARKAAVSSLVLAAYGRLPTAAEARDLEGFLAAEADSPEAFEDLLFSSLLASEFQTNH